MYQIEIPGRTPKRRSSDDQERIAELEKELTRVETERDEARLMLKKTKRKLKKLVDFLGSVV